MKNQIVNEWKSIAIDLIAFDQDNQGIQVLPLYEKREFNFTSYTEFSIKFEVFTDKSGQNRFRSFEGSGIITYQNESNVNQGAFLCQFHINKTAILTLHTDDLVHQFNKIQTGGITWVKDKPQDVTLSPVPAFNKLAGQYFILFDLIYIKDNYLYTGEVDALGNMASIDEPPRGLREPLIPLSDDTTPLTLDELKEEIVKGVWTSVAKEVRPSLNSQGQVTTSLQTRKIQFPDDSSFNLILSSFPGPGQTESFMDIEIIGDLIWEEDASAVVAGAQFVQFVVNQLYITPKTAQMVSNLNQNLPQGLDPFQLNQKANLTEKDFPALGFSKDTQIKENDLLFQRQNRLFLGARPVDGKRPYPADRRTYSLSDDLIDPERSASIVYILMLNMLIAVWI